MTCLETRIGERENTIGPSTLGGPPITMFKECNNTISYLNL
jgi:hypothetical protein